MSSPGPGSRRSVRRVAAVCALAVAAGVLALAGLRSLARSRTTQLFGALVARVETTDSVVALTFDDGPTREVAPRLIHTLASRGVRATFFVTGAEVAGAPDVARALAAAGHELANHSYSHRRMVLMTPGAVRRELARTDSLLLAAGAREPIFFRPPYGYKLVALPWVAWRANRTTVTWDVEPDSYPSVAATPEGIVTHVLEHARPGSIILLHPWYPGRATSLAAVPPLVDSLHARGFRVTTVGDLLARGRRGGAP